MRNTWCPPLGGWTAVSVYLVLSLALTWPLVLGLGRDVPGDLGDSLLNMWILAWGADHLPRLFTGALSWSEFWNANIFHPEPLTFALSENLFGQALQILPIYWLTGNIILCYNLLFIATFALSAFGTYLLVRDLTGDTRAAFIAGLVYGFLPYRIPSIPHLQVLSSQWMPFALWGLNRFITRFPDPGSRFPARGALAFATGALVLQNWSCVYYLMFFAPFLLLFVVHRLSTTGRLRDVRVWTHLAAGAVATVALTLPFLLPYRQAQERFGIARATNEAEQYSANVWSYLTASENLRLWGRALRFYPYGEGETFLGFMPWLLAVVALASLFAPSAAPDVAPTFRWGNQHPRAIRVLTWILGFIALTQFIALMSTMIFGGFSINVFGIPIRARTAPRLLLQFMIPMGVLLAMSPRARQLTARLFRSPQAFFLFAVVLAIWLSLGPVPSAGQARATGFGLYVVLHDFVPGFNGLRVPARFAMIAGLFLAVLSGFGAASILRERGRLAVAAIALLIVIEGLAVPIEINRLWHTYEKPPPPRVYSRADAPDVYKRVATLPAGSVITEFPFGDQAWEIRYVYYSAVHWKPITNGYSGGFPRSYSEQVARLERVTADPEASWQSLRAAGTTHVVLHRTAFNDGGVADAIEAWLKAHGAREMERFQDGDILFAL